MASRAAEDTSVGAPDQVEFVPLRDAAEALGVPICWLRCEARANLVPHIVASRRLLFNVESVRRALVDRAIGNVISQAVPA